MSCSEPKKTSLVFYVTGHPLDSYRPVIEHARYRRLGLVEEMQESRKSPCLCGIRQRYRGQIYEKNQASPLPFFTLEDFTGSIEAIAWSDVYQEKYRNPHRCRRGCHESAH